MMISIMDPIKKRDFETISSNREVTDYSSSMKMLTSLEAQALLAAVVDSSEDAIISKTLDGRILSWNKAAERLFGYKANEAIGKQIIMLIPADRQHEERMIIDRLSRGERIEHYQTVRKTKDDKLVDISLAISPIRDSSGEIIGASKIARNITEQKRLQEALATADRRKDEFLAMLAHELRNPLAPIQNALNIFEAPKALYPMRTEALKLIKRQVHQMTRLIDDLMDVSRINQGKISLQKKRISLNEAIPMAQEIAAPVITAKKHTLVISQPDEPLWIQADIVRLSQILSNLLNNAAKYTDEGGRIELSIWHEDNEAVISVKDNGIGIPRDMLPSVFDLFMQVDGSLERSHGGLGIGLTLVKELTALHGGTVTAFSDGPGKGSEFTLRLPLAQTPEIKTAQDVSTPATETQYRTLVVDDNEASAKTMGWTLELMGHEVHVIMDARKVLEAARSFKPHVIMLDIGMPGINGYDLCKQLREDLITQNAFIVAQTGWGQEEHRKRSQSAGFDYHLVKPVDMQALEKALASQTKR